MEKLKIGNRLLGIGEIPYVIAEVGSNHNGDMNLAFQLVDAAKACGADAVKFQSWSKISLISKAEYARNTEYADKKRHFGSLEEMVETYQLTPAQHHQLVDYCREREITFLSSVFSPQEVDLLEDLDVAAYKIASMDVVHLPLLRYVAQTKRPVILSTGMATLGELERAIQVLRDNGAGSIVLLHCVSVYPPAYDAINLRNIGTLQQVFNLPVGFSDHTIGTAIPLAAIALGACVIEKHFTLDKDMAGWDHWISANPEDLEKIVREGRNVAAAIGGSVRVVSAAEVAKRDQFRRSIVVRHSMTAGEVLTLAGLDFKRPGTGISPDKVDYVIGRTLSRNVEGDQVLCWDDFV